MASVDNRGTAAAPLWVARYVGPKGRARSAELLGVVKRADAMRAALELEAKATRQRLGLDPAPVAAAPVATPEAPCRALMLQWRNGDVLPLDASDEQKRRAYKGLTNRAARNDRSRIKHHLLPRWGTVPLSMIDVTTVMKWLDEMAAAGELSPATQRSNLALLSRFFSWCIERGHAKSNPVRSVPPGKRPKVTTKRDVPWLQDDGQVARLMRALPAPFDLMFFLGNRSGLRTGELAGLRLADLGFLAKGSIRVRYSYSGPLKEDRDNSGKVKWVPAPGTTDAIALLVPWLEGRRAEGAGDEDFVFPRVTSKGPTFWRREDIHERWKRARKATGLTLSWYQATRHSFASRNLANGASLDEVSAALGHSSPLVTKQHYDHFVRKTFSAGLRAELTSRVVEREAA